MARLLAAPCLSREHHEPHEWGEDNAFFCVGRHLPIRCTGRAVNDALQPVGKPCGRAWHDGEEAARVAGWSIAGEHVMCPACRRPDPVIQGHIRDILKGLRS